VVSNDERTILLVRHGATLDRATWNEDDSVRPLDAVGFAQAEALADRILAGGAAGGPIVAVVSSPALRCRQTVGRLAERVGLTVQLIEMLAEGAEACQALSGLISMACSTDPGVLVACSHGDVIDGVLEELPDSGAQIDGMLMAPKGSTWELTLHEGRLVRARYVAPPSRQSPSPQPPSPQGR